jgi:hypothetical protein
LQLAPRGNCTEAANVLIEALGISSGFYDEFIGIFCGDLGI